MCVYTRREGERLLSYFRVLRNVWGGEKGTRGILVGYSFLHELSCEASNVCPGTLYSIPLPFIHRLNPLSSSSLPFPPSSPHPLTVRISATQAPHPSNSRKTIPIDRSSIASRHHEPPHNCPRRVQTVLVQRLRLFHEDVLVSARAYEDEDQCNLHTLS